MVGAPATSSCAPAAQDRTLAAEPAQNVSRSMRCRRRGTFFCVVTAAESQLIVDVQPIDTGFEFHGLVDRDVLDQRCVGRVVSAEIAPVVRSARAAYGY